MPYEIVRYHCNVCRMGYKLHAEARRCETESHRTRSVWPSAEQMRNAARPTPTDAQNGEEGQVRG